MMKKNTGTLLLFILLGLITGSLLAMVLSHVEFLTFLTQSQSLAWHPRADLNVVKYDFLFEVRISLLSILGAVLAILIYRKL
jgi:hypothetical protein